MSGAYRGRGFGRGRFQSWKRGRGGGNFSGRWRERENRVDLNEASGKHASAQASQPLLQQSTLDQFIPYKGWKLYFSEVYSNNSPFIEKIQAFEKFFTRHIDLYDKDEIERKGSILVDFKELTKADEITNLIPDIENALRDAPEKTLACMGLAIHQVLTKDLERHAAELQAQEGLSNGGETMVNVPHIYARVYNYEPLTHLKNIRATCYGKYISIRGTVVRVSNIKPLCTNMAFQCAACGEIQSFPLPDGKYALQDFYLELRKQSQRVGSSPITTRQLESLIRLTEARARLELREEATREDAEDIIEIMKHSMLGTYSDEFGNLDFERSQHGSGMSNRSTAKRFISALNSIAERTYNNIFQYHQLRQIAKELNIQVADFENFIGSLNDQGYLLKKGPKIYQLQTM